MRRPSVVFINRVYPPHRGATGRVLRDLARSFVQEGWQVTVVTTGPKAVKEKDAGVRVLRVKGPEKPSGMVGYAWVWTKMLFAALRLQRPHLVVTMSDPPLLVLAGHIFKLFKKTRHIHWCHDLYPDILPALEARVPDFMVGTFRKVTSSAMGKADKVIVIGRCMARHLAHNGLDPKHITMIPNWPDAELMRNPPANQNASVQILHTAVSGQNVKPPEQQLRDDQKFRVLYAGNMGRAHPVETILDAAEMLNDIHPEIEFVFVGEGPRFDHIARERAHRNLNNVRLLPYQPAGTLREMMESGDLHLVSMKDEAAGMLVPVKLYTALAVGRPCIFVGPAQCEAAKVISDFGAGSIVAQGQPQTLAAEIVRFRMNGDDWFAAHEGALNAGRVYLPKDAIDAWIERAWGVVKSDIRVAS